MVHLPPTFYNLATEKVDLVDKAGFGRLVLGDWFGGLVGSVIGNLLTLRRLCRVPGYLGTRVLLINDGVSATYKSRCRGEQGGETVDYLPPNFQRSWRRMMRPKPL